MRNLFFAVSTLTSLASFGATYKIDTSHSNVTFKVKHLVVSTVSGRFNKFAGTFIGDEKSKKLDSINADIEVTSVDTNDPKRDEHLKGPDFFDSGKFPTISFKSSKVETKNQKSGKISGDLTIRGVTKPVVLDATYEGSVKDLGGNQRVAFKATTQINRKDFGVSWNKALDGGGLVVGDNVEIIIEGEGVAQK